VTCGSFRTQNFSTKNGLKVINKLKNGSTFDEALFQIYIAKCILGELNIEFLEEDNKNKIVDWKITDSVTRDELLVELTELRNEASDDKESRGRDANENIQFIIVTTSSALIDKATTEELFTLMPSEQLAVGSNQLVKASDANMCVIRL
jgi:hypothetical protein